jgi:hypothetical protein
MRQEKQSLETVADLVAEIERIREELLVVQIKLEKLRPEQPVGKYDGEK